MVVPLVESEKNVDAWVVSMLRENVYDDCAENPLLNRLRSVEDHGVVPRIAVAALELDCRKRSVGPRPAGGIERRTVGADVGNGQIHVARAQQVNASRAGVTQCDHGVPPEFPLNVHVPNLRVGVIQIELDRPYRERAVEIRNWKSRVVNHWPRGCRRICHGDDQVLLVVGIEVNAVAAAHTRATVSKDVPGETNARRKIPGVGFW